MGFGEYIMYSRFFLYNLHTSSGGDASLFIVVNNCWITNVKEALLTSVQTSATSLY
jgi:hypothetical protein